MLKAHIKALKDLEGRGVEAGWFETDRYPSEDGRPGVSVASVARTQEFGATIKRQTDRVHQSGAAIVPTNTTITIPARPFMRLAWSMFQKDRSSVQAKIAHKIVVGEIDVEQGLGQIGLALEGYIVKSIKSGNWVPNAPSTVAGKGFDKPLIDSAHMWQSVGSKVY